MAAETGDEHEQCLRLLEAWSLGPVTGIERQLNGAVNRVYRVQSDAGVSFLPTVALLSARSGSSVVQVEGVVCALYEAATGTQLQNGALSSRDAAAAAACLGHLHRALQPLPDAEYRRWQIAWGCSARAKVRAAATRPSQRSVTPAPRRHESHQHGVLTTSPSRSWSSERMAVSEPGKAGEIAVRRYQFAPVLDGKGSMVGVRDQLSAGVRRAAQARKNVPTGGSGHEQPRIRSAP